MRAFPGRRKINNQGLGTQKTAEMNRAQNSLQNGGLGARKIHRKNSHPTTREKHRDFALHRVSLLAGTLPYPKGLVGDRTSRVLSAAKGTPGGTIRKRYV